MNLLRLPLVFVALAASVQAFAAALPVSSTITAATVYADRAVVTRSGHVDLASGPSELTFTGLPAGLVDNSLQVTARGTAATILDVTSRTIFVELTADPRIKTVEDELTALQRQDRTLQDKLAVASQQQALLAKIEASATAPQSASKETISPRPTFEDWQKLLTFSADNATRVAAERQALDLQREQLAHQITAAKARLEQFGGEQSSQPRATKTVTVRVATAQAGALDISLAYSVSGAAWGPAYDARLHSDERSLELTYFGQVVNATGEDWKAIELTLSTARPNLGAGAPELDRWTLEASRPYADDSSNSLFAKKPKRPDPSATMIGADGSVSGSAAADPFAAPSVASVDATLSLAFLDPSVSSASFKIPTTSTILSDNTAQKVGIATARLPANLQYEAAPKQLETAFLSANLVNTTDFPLLAGAVSTFLDNTFVTTGQLKTVMPGEKFSVDLGADEGIAVKRKLINRFNENAGFSGKTKRVTYEFLVTVTNHKRTPERVIVKDVLPVSRDEKIVVKLLAPAEKEVGTKDKPGREVTREDDGKLVWRLDLKPGEKRELPFKFTVENPADVVVTGLE